MAKAPAPKQNPPKRGEIWLVDFDPAVGAEIRKLRPALVISLDSIGRLPLRLVVPITDWKPNYAQYPWFVELPADTSTRLMKPSGADAFQVKSVSLSRFVQRLGVVAPAQLDEIAWASRCVWPRRKSNNINGRKFAAGCWSIKNRRSSVVGALLLRLYKPFLSGLWRRLILSL